VRARALVIFERNYCDLPISEKVLATSNTEYFGVGMPYRNARYNIASVPTQLKRWPDKFADGSRFDVKSTFSTPLSLSVPYCFGPRPLIADNAASICLSLVRFTQANSY